MEAVRLDDWSAAQGNPLIQLMKFDIQAAELSALRGAERLLAGPVLLIYTEVFFNAWYEQGALFSQIDQHLRGSGFALYNLFNIRSDDRGLLLWASAIFAQTRKPGW